MLKNSRRRLHETCSLTCGTDFLKQTVHRWRLIKYANKPRDVYAPNMDKTPPIWPTLQFIVCFRYLFSVYNHFSRALKNFQEFGFHCIIRSHSKDKKGYIFWENHATIRLWRSDLGTQTNTLHWVPVKRRPCDHISDPRLVKFWGQWEFDLTQ